MKVICAWCCASIEDKNTSTTNGGVISHGICPECAKKLIEPLAQPMSSFLDRFPAPVFLVDDNVRVIVANEKAYSLLKKKSSDVDGKLAGTAIECRYSKLPGGCGMTVHCKSCTIRLTVTDTIQTGKNHYRIPAYPDLHFLTGEKRIQFYISTQKVNNTIFLIIDEMNIVDK